MPTGYEVEMDDWLRFLGIYMCEGRVDSLNAINISAHKLRIMSALMEVLPKLKLEYSIYPGLPMDVYLYGRGRALSEITTKLGKCVKNQFPDWVWELNARQSRILLDAMILGDGDFSNKSSAFYFNSSSIGLADGFQRLALHSGLGAKVVTKRLAGETVVIKGHPYIRKSPAYRVSFYCNKTTQNPWVRTKHIEPLHGRKLNGALKIGSMETACMSVASINFLQEKSHEHSDGIDAYVCERCSSRAVVANEEMKLWKCNTCGDLASIVKYKTSHSSQLFLNEMQGMSVEAKIHTQKAVFEITE